MKYGAFGKPGDANGAGLHETRIVRRRLRGDRRPRSLGLPRRLSDVGIGPDQYSTIATNAMHDRALHANPVKITSPEQVLKIMEAHSHIPERYRKHT